MNGCAVCELIVSWYVAVLETPPPLPATVTWYVPVATLLGILIVRVLANVGFPDAGLKVNDVPSGPPLAERLTEVDVPLSKVVVTVV
mgnify:CR=1 FL=1